MSIALLMLNLFLSILYFLKTMQVEFHNFIFKLLLVYHNVTYVYIDLVFCNFAELFLSFLIDFCGFGEVPLCKIMPSANRDNFASFFIVHVPFLSFSCLTVLVKTYNTLLKRDGNSIHLCLLSDLQGKAFIFSPVKTSVI